MNKEALLGYVMEHAESSKDLGWLAGQLVGKSMIMAIQEGMDKNDH